MPGRRRRGTGFRRDGLRRGRESDTGKMGTSDTRPSGGWNGTVRVRSASSAFSTSWSSSSTSLRRARPRMKWRPNATMGESRNEPIPGAPGQGPLLSSLHPGRHHRYRPLQPWRPLRCARARPRSRALSRRSPHRRQVSPSTSSSDSWKAELRGLARLVVCPAKPLPEPTLATGAARAPARGPVRTPFSV